MVFITVQYLVGKTWNRYSSFDNMHAFILCDLHVGLKMALDARKIGVFMGQAVRNFTYSDITFLVRYSANTDIFLNQLIQFYSNNETNLHHLTIHTVGRCCPTKWRSYCDLRPQICDVISLYVLNFRRIHTGTVCPTTSRQPIRCRLSGSN